MKPYYQDDSVTIYNADCREILPHLAPVDLVLTDPPYGINENPGKYKTRGSIAKANDYGRFTWDKSRVDKDLILLALGLSKYSIVFGGNFYADILTASACWFVWDKMNYETDFADCELAWTSLPGAVRQIHYKWQGMFQGSSPLTKEQRWHPTQKPLPLMKWCILKADEKAKARNETILDPFMGSGTTLRAAKDLGRKAIGIELNEKYCEISAKRMSQEVLAING